MATVIDDQGSAVAEGDVAGLAGPVALDDMTEPLELLRQIDQQIEKLGLARRELRDSIKKRLADAEVGTVAGRPAVTWKVAKRVGVSHRLLVERYPEILPEVQDITTVRTFRVLPL